MERKKKKYLPFNSVAFTCHRGTYYNLRPDEEGKNNDVTGVLG